MTQPGKTSEGFLRRHGLAIFLAPITMVLFLLFSGTIEGFTLALSADGAGLRARPGGP